LIETAFFILFSAALCILRALLGLWAIDPATGFYEGYMPLVFLQNALLALGMAVFIVHALQAAGKNGRPLTAAWMQGLPLAAAGSVLAVCSGVMLMQELLRFTGGEEGSGLISLTAQAVGLVSGLAMAVAAFRFRSGRERGCGLLTAAIPAVYMVLLTVARFLAYPTIAGISDQRWEVCALSMGALFFLYHARALSGMGETSALAYARGWGLCFGLIGLPLCAAQQLTVMTGGRNSLLMPGPSRFSMGVLALYAVIFSCAIRPKQVWSYRRYPYSDAFR
jgi:hypothetical protein